ncbi:hypothetical protein BLNAU_11754 [Blattamonas nauphoetae]|uniref:DUF4371 domain-containing protein n=1 Tax=Blattamonas nauphoetae TaxID=2049346 RepID=A0ABQ9XRZ9_9EUKA|nr:hypothetical protein BLNAU_11754 [Blattamonas nauphoetae]
MTALADNNLGLTNCVSICTDGDAAMMSQKVGLRHFAQMANPKILFFHCAAHSFQLGIAHTFDDKRIYDFPFIIEVCYSIASYIVGAASRQNEFENAVHARHLIPKKIPLPNATRWLTRYNLIDYCVLWNSAVITHFIASLRPTFTSNCAFYIPFSYQFRNVQSNSNPRT